MNDRDEQLHHQARSLADGRRDVDLDPGRAGWTWASLRVLTLGPGESEPVQTGEAEVLVLPLAGSCAVTCAGERLELTGRTSVFDAVSDFAYLPRRASATIDSETGGRFALPGAIASNDLPFRYGPAAGVEIELRGAGVCTRQVNNFCTAETFAADRLLACEVITPAGNWSSYPPPKHDEDRNTGRDLDPEFHGLFPDRAGGRVPQAGAQAPQPPRDDLLTYVRNLYYPQAAAGQEDAQGDDWDDEADRRDLELKHIRAARAELSDQDADELWPPRTAAEAEHRAGVAAAAPGPYTDADLYDLIFRGLPGAES